MKDTVIFLSMSLIINYDKADVCKGKERLDNYISGLTRFFELLESYHDKCDIIIFDNTINKDFQIPNEIISIIPKNIIILHDFANRYGPINKGAGVIEQWSCCQSQISKYQWIIHFEPRQLLLSDYFFKSFFANPRTIFKHYLVKEKHYFWTGLFAIETERLIDFLQECTPIVLIREHCNLENIMYNYLFKQYTHIDKLDLEWYDYYANKKYIQ
jgi:hypothetical protein